MRLDVSLDLIRDTLTRDSASLDKMIMTQITDQTFNKNIDIDYSSVSLFGITEGQGFAATFEGATRRGGPQQIATFKVTVTQRIVPSESYQTTRQHIESLVSVHEYLAKDDESVDDAAKI